MLTQRGISDASASRVLVAAIVALVVTGCVAYLGLQFSRDYTASIGLLGTIDKGPAREDSTALSNELPAVAQAAFTDDAIAEIDRRAHPYSALASKLFPQWTAARLRSDLMVENIYSGATVGAVAVVFTANDRQAALEVTTAAADVLIRSRPEPQTQPQASPPPEQTAEAQANETPAPEAATPAREALPQPPAAPSPEEAEATAAADSAQLKAIREFRVQLAALARNSQDLEAQISTETDSVTAIEQEKSHLRESLVVPPPPKPIPVPPDPRRTALQSKLNAYEKVLAALRDRYTEDYPDVINARERVEELQAEMAQLPRPTAPEVERREPPRPVSDVPQRLAALDERERPMQADLEQMRGRLKAFETQAASLRRLLTTMPIKSEARRIEPAPAPVLLPAPVQPARVQPAPLQAQVEPAPIPSTKPASEVPIAPRFSVATLAEIRKTEQVISAEAIAGVSILCGLGAGFAYLAIGAGRSRKPREEAEPQQAAV